LDMHENMDIGTVLTVLVEHRCQAGSRI
jgi:hypothetical protein